MVSHLNRIPLSQQQLIEAGAELGEALSVRNWRGYRATVLRILDLDEDTIRGLGQLTEMTLGGLNLPARDPILFRKLKALVQLSKHFHAD